MPSAPRPAGVITRLLALTLGLHQQSPGPRTPTQVAATTHFTLGRIFSSPATNPEENETNFLSAAREVAATTHFTLGRIFSSLATNPDGNETNFLSAAREAA
ncbi:hypothetical protein Celaphus_00007153 [Cervus elaphus hippelaphus]|uniref:Uncharacterized protein n=1 Tax=Cervus elaphus hippelaphus TaxID=46360 RepID=A0A212CZB0_CEREH|nr:hypothetical protein Celaphus_00007153 [Cervus elaphus hippelaphus]